MPTASLPTPLQEYVHKSRYARWINDKQRRENWDETVQRYVDYFARFPHYPKDEIFQAIHDIQTMPSMRALMTAGPALDRDPMAGRLGCMLSDAPITASGFGVRPPDRPRPETPFPRQRDL